MALLKFTLEIDTDEYAVVSVLSYEPYQPGSSNSIPEECYPPEPAIIEWQIADLDGTVWPQERITPTLRDWIDSVATDKMERLHD